MKIIFLIPPSEWKNSLWIYEKEELAFNFEKPYEISINATEKDLKCKLQRFEEAIFLNKNINNSKTIEAIKRYSWVMYDSIDYEWMNKDWKEFFEENFYILSWMYWILKPLDKIKNYKLPIETKWLYDFWWDQIPESILEIKPSYIINLLPLSYQKLIWLWTNCNRHKKKLYILLEAWIKIININFLYEDTWKKISHLVKKIKWEWIKNICENNILDYKKFWWEIIDNWDIIDVNIKNK